MDIAPIELWASAPTLLVGVVFLLTALAVLLVTAPAPVTPAARLARYAQTGRRTSPAARIEFAGAGERLGAPLLRRLAAVAASAAPPRVHRVTADRLVMAGLRTSPAVFLAVRTAIFVALPGLVSLHVLRAGPITSTGWLVLGLSVVLGRKLPDIWLKRKIRARQHAIDRALPYALDLMIACLEGGLSLDASLAKVAEQSGGPLADEIGLTLQEITLGRPASEAMRAMGARAGAPDLKAFTGSVVQAERMGIGITDAMRSLAQESRVRRRQRAEQMARKAPIKMVPVLIFCILPALMVVVMTPAALMLMRIFAEQRS
jgi:tight adherence protein C